MSVGWTIPTESKPKKKEQNKIGCCCCFFITQLKLLGAVLRDPNVDDGADFVFAGFTGREIEIRGRRGVGIAARRPPLVLRVHERQRLFGLEAQRTAVDAGHQARAYHLVGSRLVVLALDLD